MTYLWLKNKIHALRYLVKITKIPSPPTPPVLVARYCIWIKPITIFNWANCSEGTSSATYWYLWSHIQLNKNWQATIPTSEGQTLDAKYKLAIPSSGFKTWLHRIAFKFGPQSEEHATDHVYYTTLFWSKKM